VASVFSGIFPDENAWDTGSAEPPLPDACGFLSAACTDAGAVHPTPEQRRFKGGAASPVFPFRLGYG
jgi:hypothetical protein